MRPCWWGGVWKSKVLYGTILWPFSIHCCACQIYDSSSFIIIYSDQIFQGENNILNYLLTFSVEHFINGRSRITSILADWCGLYCFPFYHLSIYAVEFTKQILKWRFCNCHIACDFSDIMEKGKVIECKVRKSCGALIFKKFCSENHVSLSL